MHESWSPTIHTSTGTLHGQVLEAIRHDIATGALAPDDQMPPHRELAARIGIGVGTVTRAYREAERLGLLTSTVGRGTFVATSPATIIDTDESVIDISLNLPVHPLMVTRVADALARIQHRPDLAEHLGATPHAGVAWHRQTLAAWFGHAAQIGPLDWERTLVTTGAQHAMTIAVAAHCQPGDVILTEAASFNGIRAIARMRGVECRGVAMDADGLIPAALEEAIAETGSRLLYTLPTHHNPTTISMSRTRREEIAAIVQRHQLTVIEDEVYSPVIFTLGVQRGDLVTLASLIPERTIQITSASKAVAMGLRVGILVAPDRARFEAFQAIMRADCYATSAISALTLCQMIKDGTADEVRTAIAHEASQRLVTAQRILGTAVTPSRFPTSLHLWLPMPEVQAERVTNGALRRGVILTPPSELVIDGVLISGLRVCLNTVSRDRTERALRVIRSALADIAIPGRPSIV